MISEWQELSTLLDKNEGAVFIAYPDKLRANIATLRSAFEYRYPKLKLSYSYKTNHLPRLCISAHEQGVYAEVVSGMEFDMAIKLGISGEHIHFNGPTKTTGELLKAFINGSLVNIDSLSEARQVYRLSEQHSGVIRLGLRCNLDLDWKNRLSRFGLSEQSGELDKAWSLLSERKNIRIEGLHCHTSFERSADSYRRRIIRLINIADKLFGNRLPSFLNIGGGFTGPMPKELQNQFSEPPPTYDEYAAAICIPMKERYADKGPYLILEAGVGLLGNVLDYVFKVEHLKKIGAKWFAVTSGASHHIKIVPNNFNLPITLIESPSAPQSGREGTEIDIVGYTCLEHDIIFRGFDKPLNTGDILVANNVGAYSFVSSPDFIRTSPPIYERTVEGWKLLRSKKSVDHYLHGFAW